MIQELLGEAAAGVLIGGERSKLSVNNGVVLGGSSASPSLSPTSHSSSTVSPSPTGPSSAAENLRCPRCDSTNTKFCYYNNYNLTQPRHFCKTCRRYWTKGGALRNVPIGGGCRKNKNTTMNSAFMKSSAGKFKTPATEMGKSGFLSELEHQLSSTPSNPILWASPQNPHLLSLLRGNPNLNSNSNSNPVSIKQEEIVISSGGALGQVSPAGFLTGEVQNSGVQDFYQKVRSFTNFYPDAPPVMVGNVVSSSSSSVILESAPVAAAESGYWNPILSTWSDMPTN